jgi:hypothetical protein
MNDMAKAFALNARANKTQEIAGSSLEFLKLQHGFFREPSVNAIKNSEN